MDKLIGWVRDVARGWPLLVLFALTFGWMLHVAPEGVGLAKVGLTIYGASKIALCAYLGYWVDRLCFRADARPHSRCDATVHWAWMRRAVIVAASLLAGALIP